MRIGERAFERRADNGSNNRIAAGIEIRGDLNFVKMIAATLKGNRYCAVGRSLNRANLKRGGLVKDHTAVRGYAGRGRNLGGVARRVSGCSSDETGQRGHCYVNQNAGVTSSISRHRQKPEK